MLEQLREVWESDWHPVSRYALAGWGIFYLWFFWHAAHAPNDFRFVDNANFVVHEAGHLLFGWLGYKLGIAGGTIFQFLVPFLLGAYFFSARNLPGTAFCAFFFFENFLYSAPYIADARAQNLDLLSVGGGDAEHDWFAMLSWFSALHHDLALARLARMVGWAGMVATFGWFGWRGWSAQWDARS